MHSRRLTSELSDAGGPARPNRQLAWHAHVRTIDPARLSRGRKTAIYYQLVLILLNKL